MIINERKNEIIATKAEYAKAMKVGTPEFEELFKARQMYPTAKVVVKKTKNKDNYENLTKKFMLNYIAANDKEYFEEFSELFKSIGTEYFNEKNNKITTFSFFDIRENFLNRYTQFMNERDRKKYDAAMAADKKSEENSNVVDMNKAV